MITYEYDFAMQELTYDSMHLTIYKKNIDVALKNLKI